MSSSLSVLVVNCQASLVHFIYSEELQLVYEAMSFFFSFFLNKVVGGKENAETVV